jgi:hypothetical protein
MATAIRPIEDYIEHADELAQDVVNAWGVNVSAGNSAYLTASFKALFDAADHYRTAKQIADNRREFNLLTEEEADKEQATRASFAQAYKKRWEAHQPQ